MNLSDLAKKAIDEVAENRDLEVIELPKKPKKSAVEPPQSAKSVASEPQGTTYTLTSAEARFLANIKERILVLFEGLKSAEYDEIELRLDLTINFLEFLLASIEDKLKK